MKKVWAFGFTVVAFGAGFAPVIPAGEMQLLVSGQYTVSEYKTPDAGTTTAEIKTPLFEDKDGNGVVSFSVFRDASGKDHFVEIPDTRYAEMGGVDGYSKNPKKEDFRSLIDIATPVANAAIALDAFVDIQQLDGVSSLTYSHTVAGTDRAIVVLPITDGTVTGVTYNAAALTSAGITMTDDGSRNYTLWYKVAPSTGANNVVITTSASAARIRGTSASYTGVDQTSPVNGTPTKIENTATSPVNVNITSTVADTWGVGGFRSNGGSQGNGTMSLRAVANSLGYLDTNGGLGSAGSEALNFTIAANEGWLVAMLLAPAATPVVAPAYNQEFIIIE